MKNIFYPTHINGQPFFLRKNYKAASGVYLIKEKGLFGRVVYVGLSTNNLYRTFYRHFQEWNDQRQVRTTYNKEDYKGRMIIIPASKIDKVEKFLIKKYKPKDNRDTEPQSKADDKQGEENFVKYEALPFGNYTLEETFGKKKKKKK